MQTKHLKTSTDFFFHKIGKIVTSARLTKHNRFRRSNGLATLTNDFSFVKRLFPHFFSFKDFSG